MAEGNGGLPEYLQKLGTKDTGLTGFTDEELNRIEEKKATDKNTQNNFNHYSVAAEMMLKECVNDRKHIFVTNGSAEGENFTFKKQNYIKTPPFFETKYIATNEITFLESYIAENVNFEFNKLGFGGVAKNVKFENNKLVFEGVAENDNVNLNRSEFGSDFENNAKNFLFNSCFFKGNEETSIIDFKENPKSTFVNCTFIANKMILRGDPQFVDCHFSVKEFIIFSMQTPTFDNCKINNTENIILIDMSSPKFNNCAFSSKTETTYKLCASASVNIKNSKITNEKVINAIFCSGHGTANISIEKCSFVNVPKICTNENIYVEINESTVDNSCFAINNSEIGFEKCRVINNSCTFNNSIVVVDHSSLTFSKCSFQDNKKECVICKGKSNVSFENGTAANCGVCYKVMDDSSITLTDSSIENSIFGVMNIGGKVTVNKTSITNCLNGIQCSCSEKKGTLTIKNSNISQCQNYGYVIDNCKLCLKGKNTFKDNFMEMIKFEQE